MDLKIKDVAELLNISETTIRRWLAEGKIPGYRFQKEIRFSRGEIQDWMMRTKFGCSVENPLQEIEKRMDLPKNIGHHASLGAQQYSFYRAVHKGIFLNNVPGDSKESLMRNAVSLIARDLDLDAEGLFALLWDREKLQATALNNGIGVPHTRDFLLNHPQDCISLVFPSKPIHYDALDNKPVHTLFFLFASEDKRHLHLLAKIALFCSQPATIDLLLARPTKEVFLEYVKAWEGNILKKPLPLQSG